MNNEELNTKVYEKLFAEQEKYKGWLLTQSPEEILNHAYEYKEHIKKIIHIGKKFLKRIEGGRNPYDKDIL